MDARFHSRPVVVGTDHLEGIVPVRDSCKKPRGARRILPIRSEPASCNGIARALEPSDSRRSIRTAGLLYGSADAGFRPCKGIAVPALQSQQSNRRNEIVFGRARRVDPHQTTGRLEPHASVVVATAVGIGRTCTGRRNTIEGVENLRRIE